MPALPNNPKLQAYKPSSAARLAGFPDLDFFFAGRLGIDQELMQQAINVRDAINPDEIFFVVDAMIGQDAVRTAKAFAAKIIGLPVISTIDKAAPPRASPSNLVKTTASNPTPSANAFAVLTAS